MANVAAVFRSLAKLEKPVSTISRYVNNQVSDSSYQGMFITAVIGKINIQKKEIEYINHGHEPIMIFNKDYNLIQPSQNLQKKSVNEAIKFVKMGNVKAAAKAIKPAINELIKMKCKKIILGCTELPIAIFAFKSFNNVRSSKIFLDPNLILANSAMAKHKS